jgi:tetratricopeptide (TPR) repeat protein
LTDVNGIARFIMVKGLSWARLFQSAEAFCLVYRGAYFRRRGEATEALRVLHRALLLFEACGNDRGRSKAHRELGILYLWQHEIAPAEQHLQRSLQICRARGDREGEARALDNLGLLAKNSGRLEEGLALLFEALNLFERCGSSRLDHLVRVVSETSWSPSLVWAIARAIIFGHRAQEVNALGDIGTTYRDLGDPASALHYLDRARELRRLVGARIGEGADLLKIGFVYRLALHDLPHAREYSQRALKLFRRYGYELGECEALGNTGMVEFEMGNLQPAIDYLMAGLEIAQRIGAKRIEANIVLSLGQVYQAIGDLQRSLELHQEALDLVGDELPAVQLRIHLTLGQLCEQSGNLELAYQHYLASINLIETLRINLTRPSVRRDFVADKEPPYLHAVRLRYKRASGEALELAERMHSRTLVEQLAITALAMPTGMDPTLLAEERRWLEKAHRLRSDYLSQPSFVEERRLATEVNTALEQVWQRIEDECGEGAREYVALRRGEPVGLATLRQLLEA